MDALAPFDLPLSTSLSMVDSAPFDRFTSSSSWSSTAGIGALGRKSSAGRRDAEEARRARPSAAEAHDSQSRVAQEDSELDPAMTNLLVFNNMKHERTVPDDCAGTTWGDQTQIDQASKRSSPLDPDHQSATRISESNMRLQEHGHRALAEWFLPPRLGQGVSGWCVEAQFIFPGGHEGGVPWSMNQGCVHVRLGHALS